ncbi:hypothetical protein ACK4RQ_19265 [Proteus mirabilis]|uniref:hypothetical protein n=1 Tax=Proteus mirabilis TaxID=584 RepID=UPI00073B589A|nr:hypothetical protein [Proteus mirabilis]KSY00110.1 hypothetical protein APT96_03340 [Proteus mirabilis]
MSYIHTERDFSNWVFGTSGTGNVQVTKDGILRLQNSDASSRALVSRRIMLMAGDEVIISCIGQTTSLQSGRFILAIEQPFTIRRNQTSFEHNEDAVLRSVAWKVPTEFPPTEVYLTVGLPNGTEGIAYITDLSFEVKSQNLGSRRILMDGVVKLTNGVATLDNSYDHRNVGDIIASSVNLDVRPKEIVALDRLPIVNITSIYNADDKPVRNAILQPVASFTKAGVMNIRLQHPIEGSLVMVTGKGINKTISFSIFI